jgi:high frequency lysogenization protein
MNTDSGSDHSPTLSNWEYRVLAVGFTLQCAQQIDKLAREGSTDQATVAALQEPLFVLNPKSYSSVFPKPNLLVPGLTLIESFSRGGSLRSIQMIVQYAIGMLRLADGVLANPQLASQIRHGIEAIDRSAPANANDTDISEQTRAIATIYKATLSKFPRPIQIQGSAAMLSNEDNAATIRSLLLAGVRAALFWRQLGGRRWQLFLYRKRLATTAAELKKHVIRQLH